MKIFLDAEFWEDGPDKPVQLISLAMVSQSGSELYLINDDFNWDDCDSQWLKDNVQPMLNATPGLALPYREIGGVVFKWVIRDTGGKKPQFWGYYSDYDWVVLCQTFGRMIDLPETFPKYCMDIKQFAVMCGNPELPDMVGQEHNALHDARWNKQAWEFLATRSVGRAKRS